MDMVDDTDTKSDSLNVHHLADSEMDNRPKTHKVTDTSNFANYTSNNKSIRINGKELELYTKVHVTTNFWGHKNKRIHCQISRLKNDACQLIQLYYEPFFVLTFCFLMYFFTHLYLY